MAFLHSHSTECMSSELDLFTLPATQTSIESSSFLHYKPVSSLSDDVDAPLEFVVPAGSEHYFDLAHTMLHVQAKIVPADEATATTEDLKVGPINNFMHSMFNQIDVFFNQKIVSPPNNAYPYRAYIETLLNYAPAAKESHLTASLWYDDTSGGFDSPANAVSTATAPITVNKGLENRKYFTQNRRYFDMIGHLHHDLFNQDKMLINGVEMRVRLVRSKDAFCLMDATADGKFKLSIKEATLIVRRVKISPGVLLAHAQALSKTTAKYPITRVEVKSFTLHSGILGDSIDNVIHGQLPKRIILGFVENKAFNGNRALNPFNFQHFSINYISLYVDGVQIPSKPLQPRFTGLDKLYIDAFQTLYTGTGVHFLNEGFGINRYNYYKGNFLTAFDLTPDLSAHCATHWNLVRSGSIRIEVRFETALLTAINCIVYAEYDNVLEIDSNRQIITDFSA
ncbi:uncharacterized protein F54H12.2-like [Nasonia vitripennis]|uniref:Uncharacterized protein n=1 Tax=Nasonia vitripennis TaxID=7425 RepID=A0A7M7QKF2_NASVI|nr:uncharacterized protein F54H12.2-like [Nasonia vitripennis]